MEVLSFGHTLLILVAVLLGVQVLLIGYGLALRDRRAIVAARVGFFAVFVLTAGACATLVWGFLDGQYDNEYIFGYSDRDLPVAFQFAGLWAGLDGSLLFWVLVLAGMSAITALQHYWSSRHPTGRALEPWVYLVLVSVLGFFVALAINENAFSIMEAGERFGWAQHLNLPVDHEGRLLNGKGLNPQLVNYWFVIHPPCLYFGLVTFTIPFAFGMAALITGELGNYWVRITRRWAMVAWLFLTCGIILGGLWAYRQLGWGGYWAWDPVENASFLPWLGGTAFLHSIMIQERRDLLKWWNVFLLIFSFFLTIEATYMTRSGEVDSVHSFAGGSIGEWFRYFKWCIIGSGLFLLFYRFRQLRGAHRLEAVLSREAAFFLNNLVLVCLALAIWLFSWMPNLSSSYLGTKVVWEQKDFNKYLTPAFIILLFLTAVGPALGWVKTSGKALSRNLGLPALVAFIGTGLSYAVLGWTGNITSFKEVVLPKVIEDLFVDTGSADLNYAEGIYPTGIFLFLSYLIIATLGLEFLRGVRSRVKFRKEDLLSACLRLVTRDNRRYGGYIVHVGLAVLTIGIVISSMFQVTAVHSVAIGESVRIGDYVISPLEANRPASELWTAVDKIQRKTHRVEDFEPGSAYLIDRVKFRIAHAPVEASSIKTADAQGATEVSDVPRPDDGTVLAEVDAERRWYPKQGQWINEVTIERRLLEDVYLFFRHRSPEERMTLELFVNPFMWLIYIGWVLMILGAVFALIPFSGNRVGLAE